MSVLMHGGRGRWRPGGAGVRAGLTLCAVLACALAACERGGDVAARVAGCYGPVLGPPGQGLPLPERVVLDTASTRDGDLRRYGARLEPRNEAWSMYSGHWRTLGRDSILVSWSSFHPVVQYRLRVGAGALEGVGAFVREDPGAAADSVWPVTAPRMDCPVR